MIHFVVGDATEPERPDRDRNVVIAHCCNDVGAFGSGFAAAVARRWPKVRDAYYRWHRDRAKNDFALGAAQFVEVDRHTWVANVIGQHGIRKKPSDKPVRYESLEAGLAAVGERAVKVNAVIVVPRLGCDRAGGTWGAVEQIILRTLCDRGLDVYVHDLPS